MATEKPEPEQAKALTQRQRLDKWLFFSRFAKSRTLAQSWVSSGHVSVNGQTQRTPSTLISLGDRIELRVERREHVLIVRGAGERRGPFEEARHLYDDVTPERPKEAQTAFEIATRDLGAGRPTKKDRRALDRLRDPFDES